MRQKRTLDVITIALAAAIIAVCSWITIPVGAVPFTMQTFAVFVAALLLGSIRGALAVIIYILLGIVGLPVFSSFQSGLGVLLGATGGFLTGFIFIPLIGGAFSRKFPDNTVLTFVGLILGLVACYSVGTLWFMHVYLDGISVSVALTTCVVPYIIPDILKMALAAAVSKKVMPVMKGRIQ